MSYAFQFRKKKIYQDEITWEIIVSTNDLELDLNTVEFSKCMKYS